jgi:hypothetical protein
MQNGVAYAYRVLHTFASNATFDIAVGKFASTHETVKFFGVLHVPT